MPSLVAPMVRNQWGCWHGIGAETCMVLPRMVAIQPVSAASFSRSALGIRSNNLERNEMRG